MGEVAPAHERQAGEEAVAAGEAQERQPAAQPASIAARARATPGSLSGAEVSFLQRSIGNAATVRMLTPPRTAATSHTAVSVQRKFSEAQRAKAKKHLDDIETFLRRLVSPDGNPGKRGDRKDMALGLTEIPENRLSEKRQERLLAWLEDAERDGEEPEILARARQLKSLAEGAKGEHTNLRLFGDKAKASTWMDWVPVDASVAAQYRAWFEKCAVEPVVAKDGRFKFNLAGYEPDECRKLVESASKISREEMDRRVDAKPGEPGRISKTDWELLEVLAKPSLRARTDFLLFDSKTDTEPVEMTAKLLQGYGIDKDKGITLLDHKIFLEEQAKAAAAAAEREKFLTDGKYRQQLLTARWEEELKKFGMTLNDLDKKENEKGKEAYEDAQGEALWENAWKSFDELWNNGSKWYFEDLRKAKSADTK